jgi:glycosyltransferase involved in cell wall biosynthesis
MSRYIISRALSDKVLMIGVYYKHHAPGGMAAVIQYYSQYIEHLNYVCSWRLTHFMGRVWYAGYALVNVIARLLFDRKIKILHIHVAADASYHRKMIFVKLGKLMKKKVILHVHSSRFKDFYDEQSEDRKKKIEKELTIPDKLLVLSESWKEWFQGINIPSEHIEVLHNITEQPVEMPVAPDGKTHLLFLGELGQRKGVFDLLKAISNNKDEFRNKIVLRIGGNKNEEKLKSFISDNNLLDFVFFEGWVAGDKKRHLLNWADIYVLPSFNEGLPIGILEAMSYRCVIVSTPVGGIPEIVIPNKNGLLVEPGNVAEIAEAIRKLIGLENLEDYKKASECMVQAYLPMPVMEHLKNIYNQLLLTSE